MRGIAPRPSGTRRSLPEQGKPRGAFPVISRGSRLVPSVRASLSTMRHSLSSAGKTKEERRFRGLRTPSENADRKRIKAFPDTSFQDSDDFRRPKITCSEIVKEPRSYWTISVLYRVKALRVQEEVEQACDIEAVVVVGLMSSLTMMTRLNVSFMFSSDAVSCSRFASSEMDRGDCM